MSNDINEGRQQDIVSPGRGEPVYTPADSGGNRERNQADTATFADTPLLDQHVTRNDYPPQSPYDVEAPISEPEERLPSNRSERGKITPGKKSKSPTRAPSPRKSVLPNLSPRRKALSDEGTMGSGINKEDGGWHGRKVKNKDEQQNDQTKPRREILTKVKKPGAISPPEPYSNNNLVIQNGRVPQARQQSTLFKNVRRHSTKWSNDFQQLNQLHRLPAAIGHTDKGYHVLTHENVVPARSQVVTTLRTDRPLRKTNQAVTKVKIKLSKSEAHYVRFAKLVVKVGSDLLRLAFYKYLDKQHPPKKLHQFLSTNKRRLKNFSSSYSLISKRWDIMYPNDNEHNAQLAEMDAALIFWFMRFICHMKRPNDFIWKRKPSSDDFTETGDIARIRDFRNFLINLSLPALYDEEYERKLEDLKKVALRVCGEKQGEEFERIIDNMRASTVKHTEKDHYMNMLNDWADETGDRYIDVEGPYQMYTASLKQLQDITRRFLHRHRNPKVFIRTKAYQRAHEKLQKYNCVVLTGNTGEGKTTTAIALMVSLFDEDECLLVSSPEHWQSIDTRAVRIVLLDDIFGAGSLDEKLMLQWSARFHEINESCKETVEKTGLRVIITIRSNILEQCESRLTQFKLFGKDRFVDCSSKELSINEKKAMLTKHLQGEDKSLVRSEVDKSSKVHTSSLGYPECCHLYSNKEAFMVIGSQFFERPIEILLDYLNSLYDGSKYAYLAMVVMMFQKEAILFARKLQEFTDELFREKTLDLAYLCEVSISDRIGDFLLDGLQSQVGSLVSYYEDRDCFTFSHESIMEAMMASFGERHPKEVLEGCSLPFLMDFVGTGDDQDDDDTATEIFLMRVKKTQFLVLAKVMEHYILHGEVKRISQHRAMKNPTFVEFLFEYFQQKGSISHVLLSEDNNFRVSDGSHRRVGLLYGAIDQEVPNRHLVSAILNTGVHLNKPMKEKWCEAELEAALCMAVERGSFEIYKALVDAGVPPPDTLFYEARFLNRVDIVRDLLGRRYWSSEQKDIAVVRAARGEHAESQDIVTLLLQDGASVNSIRLGSTALCEAVKSGKMKTVLMLLSSGASVHDRDRTQNSPLHHAVDWNNIEIVKTLLKRNADVNARDFMGFTPFHVAAGWGREAIMELLMAKRVNCLAADEQDNTVLHICAANGQTKMMKMILDKYKDEIEDALIARNRHGWTPLDFALRCGHFGVCKLLIFAILKHNSLKTQMRTFVHTRFYVVKFEDFDVAEKCQYRFLDPKLARTCFQMPRGNWFIQAGNREEYEGVREFSMKYENKLRQKLAKS